MKLSMKFYGITRRIAGNLVVGLVLISTLFACATAEQKRASRAQDEAFAAAFTRGIHAHVYEMSCQAVLPVAEELLIKRGYSTLVYDQEGFMVEMQWKEGAEGARARYVVQGMALGEQRCNVQVMAEKEVGGQKDALRSEEVELELLKRIQPEQAKAIKNKAQGMAEQMYQDSLLQDANDVQKVHDRGENEMGNDQL